MLTQAEAAKQRRALQRDIERSHREKAAATLRRLRAELHVARGKRNEALAQAKMKCRDERLALRERAHARRQRALAELRDTYARERVEARDVCLVRKAEVHAQAKDPVERAKGQWEAERKYQEDLRRIERGNRERRTQIHHTHARERQSESDDVVASNISPDYLALWNRVKRSIKGSTRESRTEAFLRYVEQNPEEVTSALVDDTDRLVRQLEEERDKAERALRARRPPQRSTAPAKRTSTPEELAAVPF